MEISGKRGKDKWLPHLLGHEAVGKVVNIGKSVSKVKILDEIIVSWIKGSGLDVNGPSYLYRNKKINYSYVYYNN